MKTKPTLLVIATALGIGIGLSSSPAAAETVYGWQLMTPQEWAAHRTTMWNLPPAERAAYRARHHEEMRKLAEAKGLTLPDEPTFARARGRGYGPGAGFRRPGSAYESRGPGRGRCWRR